MVAGMFDDAWAQLAIMLSIDEYNHEAKELRHRVRIHRATGGDPDLTVLVHDRSKQLIGLLSFLIWCHVIMVRGCDQMNLELKRSYRVRSNLPDFLGKVVDFFCKEIALGRIDKDHLDPFLIQSHLPHQLPANLTLRSAPRFAGLHAKSPR